MSLFYKKLSTVFYSYSVYFVSRMNVPHVWCERTLYQQTHIQLGFCHVFPNTLLKTNMLFMLNGNSYSRNNCVTHDALAGGCEVKPQNFTKLYKIKRKQNLHFYLWLRAADTFLLNFHLFKHYFTLTFFGVHLGFD